MNACFYIAIDRLPLGTVAAIEFLPVRKRWPQWGCERLATRSPWARPSPVSIC